MENLSLEEFNPKMAEVKELANKYRSLVIKGVEDVDGYKTVHNAQMDLVHTRTNIVKASKAAREKAVAYNKAVLKLEKDLIDEIKPVEKQLEEQKDVIDKLKERASRMELLPDRQAKLASVGANLSVDEIIDMDATQFQVFLNNAKSIQLAEQEAKIKAENDRLALERSNLNKEKEEAEIKRQAELDAQKKAAEDLRLAGLKADQDARDAKLKADKEKQDILDNAEREKKDAQAKADKEKQDLIDEQKRQEDARLAKIQKDKDDEDARIAKEKKDKEELEKKARYQKWLSDNGVTKDNNKDFNIQTSNGVSILWKKISEFKL